MKLDFLGDGSYELILVTRQGMYTDGNICFGSLDVLNCLTSYWG